MALKLPRLVEARLLLDVAIPAHMALEDPPKARDASMSWL